MTSCLLVVEAHDGPKAYSSRSTFADLDVGL
jgi:hypothetical protein